MCPQQSFVAFNGDYYATLLIPWKGLAPLHCCLEQLRKKLIPVLASLHKEGGAQFATFSLKFLTKFRDLGRVNMAYCFILDFLHTLNSIWDQKVVIFKCNLNQGYAAQQFCSRLAYGAYCLWNTSQHILWSCLLLVHSKHNA